jgi:ABC-type Na+ efflux pump permease subunit
MFGPVFTLELKYERRSGRLFRLLPWAWAALLSTEALFFWLAASTTKYQRGDVPPPAIVEFSSKMQEVVAQHFLVLLLLTPALTASALGEDKARGTLADLFTTALTSTEIVAGKLLPRSLGVLEVILPSLPILFLVGGYAGLSLHFFAALLLVSLLVVLGVGAIGLFCAVESKHTSGALVATYALVGAGGLAVRLVPLPALDPLKTLALASHAADPWTTARELGGTSLAWLAVAGVFFAGAVWRLRPDGLRLMHRKAARPCAEARERSAVGDDPIRWRGYHVEGLALLPLFRRFPRALGVFATGAAATGGSTYSAWQSVNHWSRYRDSTPWFFMLQAAFFLFAATLLVTVRAARAVTGERERDTWDSLRLTPLDGRAFLRGKLRGIFDSVLPYVLAYAIPAAFLSPTGGPLGMLVTLTSLLIAWPLMYYAACSGLRASVLGRNTWGSLLAALFAVYGPSLMICVACHCVVMVLFMVADYIERLRGPAEVVVLVLAWCVCAIASSLALAALGRSQMRQAEGAFLDAPSAPAGPDLQATEG